MEVPEVLSGERVDRAVALLCEVTRAEAADLVAQGSVSVDGAVVATRSRRLVGGQTLEVAVEAGGAAGGAGRAGDGPAADASVEVAVVFADEAVIVVDKPAGLVVHPGAGHRDGTLVNGLLARFPELDGVGEAGRPGIVHRLDAGTSGLLMAARTPDAYRALVAQLSARTVDRRYLALVWGSVEAESGLVDAAIGRNPNAPAQMAVVGDTAGRPARTRYRVVRRFAEPVVATLVECKLETGRTHQIRVHLAAIGHPVVGDDRYRGRRRSLPAGRPMLHAYRLGFDHPVDGRALSFESPPPADLETVLGLLA